MDAVKIKQNLCRSLDYPEELYLSYLLLNSNLSAISVSEAKRSDEEDYREELQFLAIKIEYPIHMERYQTSNTVHTIF